MLTPPEDALYPVLGQYQQAGERAEQRGIDLAGLQDASISYVADWIARRFEVSTDVVFWQLRLEGLI